MNRVMPRTLQGFFELNPEDQILFNKMVDIIRHTYENYGYLPIDTPIIEYSEILLAKAGGETEKQIYRFTKGDNDLSLRFDLTVPLARYVSERYNELVFPFKRYQIGKVFRGERPQRGRFREFYQCDIDIIGEDSLSLRYDSELPNVIYDIFKKLDIGKFVIKINNRKILTGFFNSIGLSDKVTEILRVIDKIDKIGISEVRLELEKLDIDNNRITNIIDFMLIEGSNKEKIDELYNQNIEDEVFYDGVRELERVINNLDDKDIEKDSYIIDLTIARGLDYYTGTVYETILVDNRELGSICSGGRYDNLASCYTDKTLVGVGVSIGLSRLFFQLRDSGIIRPNKATMSDILILPMTNDYKYIDNVASILRSADISVDICYLDKNFKSLMKYANRMKVPYIIIIGDNEVERKIVTLKNMTTGEQKEIEIIGVVEVCKGL